MRMSSFNPVSVVLMSVLCSASTAGAQATAKFTDQPNGVTFRYPENWKNVPRNQFYLGQIFVPKKVDVRGVVAWKAWENTVDAKTTLAGTQFVYAIDKNVSSAACLHPQPEGDTTASPVDTVKIGEMEYAHGHGGEGGMCHSERENVYATYRNHACYLFDLSVHTICSGVVDGMRDATQAELADADAKLMGILRTVTITAPKTTAAH